MPDRAHLTAVIDAEGATREAAYREAAESARQVDEVLQGRASALGRASTAGLVVHPKSRWKRGETQRTGWRASRTTELEVTAFDQLGDLIAELAAARATITGLAWQLDSTNPAFATARRLAAADARSRAEDYAAALGLQLGAVVWIAEPGLRRPTGADYERMPVAARSLSAAGPRAAEETITVTADEMTAQAAVEVGFSLRSNLE